MPEIKYSCPRCGYCDPDVAPVNIPEPTEAKPEAAPKPEAVTSPELKTVVKPEPATTVKATIAGQEVKIPVDAIVEHDGQTETAGQVAPEA